MEENNNFIPLYRDIMFKKFFGSDEYIYLTQYLLKTLLDLDDDYFDESVIINTSSLRNRVLYENMLDTSVFLFTTDRFLYVLKVIPSQNEENRVTNVLYVMKYPCFDFVPSENSLDFDLSPVLEVMSLMDFYEDDNLIQKVALVGRKNHKDFKDSLLSLTTVNLNLENDKFNEVSKEFEVIRKFLRAESLEEMEKLINKSDVLSQDLLDDIVNFMNRSEVQKYNEEN